MQNISVMCIDDEPDFLMAIKLRLGGLCNTATALSIDEGIFEMQRSPAEIVLLDVGLGSESGVDGIGRIKKCFPDADIVMLSGQRSPKTVVDAIKAGATDFLAKPFNLEDFEAVVERLSLLRMMRERYTALVESQNICVSRVGIVHKSYAIQKVLSGAGQLKGHIVNVLIAGETGTGKELLARYIHSLEDNPARPFVAVNCAAIPENLIEAELFGAEPGAYTGAAKRRIGKFELADGGDIFLDEVSSLALNLQAKILRVLQEREFCRLGGNETVRANFRVIAAANESLDVRVGAGSFRLDLYHRLRVIEFEMPPLRERVEDIPVLAQHFLEKFARDGLVKKMTDGALARLMSYNWPGNVRELSNVIQGLTILSKGNLIDASAFPAWTMNGLGQAAGPLPVACPPVGITVNSLKDYIARAERHYIEFALRACHNDRTLTAKRLSIGRTTLYGKLKELGLM